ncbi:hypothetical protein OBE_11383, partial [human gut metagenome]
DKILKPNKGLTILLAGRPYHTDPLIQHKLSEMIANLGADAGYADGVGADAEAGFEVLGVHEQSREIVPVGVQTEQYTDAYVVDAAFHRAVHRFGVVGVVALRTGGVECFVKIKTYESINKTK